MTERDTIIDAASDGGGVTAPVDTLDPAADEAVGGADVVADEGDDAGEVEVVEPDVTAIAAQRDEYLEDLQRARAEFANYRKRTMRDGAAQREQGSAEVLARLLDVLDDLELALGSAGAGGDGDGLYKNVEMVHAKLVDTLRSFGLERYGVEGEPFDPQLHHAVQQDASEDERDQPVVTEVLRPGYRVGERVLRAAMVRVAS